MMPQTPQDSAIYSLVSGPAPATIADVIARMQRIDAALPDTDGLKWFNRMYLMVTQEVDTRPPAGGWHDAAWLTDLDVIFAGLYFRAVKCSIESDGTVPGSWRAVMEARALSGIDRIQFAIAGMNAHINHDLALALLATDEQFPGAPAIGSPQHQDYEAVNQLLHAVMPDELTMLAVDTLGVVAQDTGKIGSLLAFWDLCKARDFAWQFADHLRGLAGLQRAAALTLQDQMTGVVGRAILSFQIPQASRG